MDNAQNIDRDFVLPQKAISLHHLLVGRLLALGHTIPVVQRLRTVEAEPDGKVSFAKKRHHSSLSKHAIRLYAVRDASARGQVLALKFDNPAENSPTRGGSVRRPAKRN